MNRFDEEEEAEIGLRHGTNNLLLFLGGAALGVGAMYLFDPDRGPQRRAWMRDKGVHWRHRMQEAADATSRDVAQRSRGVMARTRSLFARDEPVADSTLIERVRSEMGRKVSHPRAIVVDANEGIVTLAGPVLSDEVGRLLACVERVRGVRGIEDRLEVHATSVNVPELQGGAVERSPRPNLWAREWPPAYRLPIGLAGAGLMVFGLPRRTVGGYAFGLSGTALLLRALTNSRRLVPQRGSEEGANRNDAEEPDHAVESSRFGRAVDESLTDVSG